MMYFRYFTGAVDNTSVRLDQVNLLAYGPDRPYFKQKQKKNIFQRFDQLAFLISYFLLFFFRKKKKHHKLIKSHFSLL